MREGNGSDGLHYLKQGIYERQTELHNLAKILSQKAEIRAKQGAASRVITIVLGAIVATQGVAENIAGEGSPGILLTYTVIGVLIAAIATFRGCQTRGGARGVGHATSRTVVETAVLILCGDYVMTALLF